MYLKDSKKEKLLQVLIETVSKHSFYCPPHLGLGEANKFIILVIYLTAGGNPTNPPQNSKLS
jgi:hypothetical protein